MNIFRILSINKVFILISLLSIFIISAASESLYYNEDFSNGTTFSNKWDTDVRCGREGFIVDNSNSSSIVIANNKLQITGQPLTDNGSWGYHTIIIGRAVKLTNLNGKTSFSANPYNPFGFEVIRTASCVWDGHAISWPEDMGTVNIWLIEENNVVQSNWNQFENFIFFWEGMKYTWGTSSRWGYFKGAETRCFLTNALRPNGTGVDLTSLEFDYLNYTSGTPEPSADHTNFHNTNYSDVGIRLTYDGSMVKFYMNPDPNDDSNPMPNEYCLVAETAFSITNNLRIMIGHEDNSAQGHFGLPWSPEQYYDAYYTNILIRTVANSSSSMITPNEIPAYANAVFTNTIKAEFNEHDSGIGQIVMEKPDIFGDWSDIRALINNKPLEVLRIGNFVGKNQVLALDDGNTLKLRFLQNKPLTGGAIKDNKAVIKIVFSLDTKNISQSDINKEFEFYTFIDCVKYDYTGYSLWSTTGPMRCRAVKPNSNNIKIINTALVMK